MVSTKTKASGIQLGPCPSLIISLTQGVSIISQCSFRCQRQYTWYHADHFYLMCLYLLWRQWGNSSWISFNFALVNGRVTSGCWHWNPDVHDAVCLFTRQDSLDIHKHGKTLQWRHNERSNHQLHDWLLSCLFSRRPKKTPKLCVTGCCERNSPVTSEFPAQRASSAKNVSIWWRHHGTFI